MQNLVLSVVKDRHWNDIRCYANSLVRSGFKGDKVMIVDNVSKEAIDELTARGFYVIGQAIEGPHHFQTNRYRYAHDFLVRTQGNYEYVFWTDVCDLVFQRDPFSYIKLALPGVNVDCVLAVKEGWKIKNQPINDLWMQRITQGGDQYQKMREEEVLCSGTIAGFAGTMSWLFHSIITQADKMMDAMQGIDQGIYNFLLRTEPFRTVTKIAEPQDAFVTTAGIFLAPSNKEDWTIQCPIFDHEKGTASVMTGWESKVEYAVLHQYNRNYGHCDPNNTFRFAVEERYWNL